jgi:hypothetical protein
MKGKHRNIHMLPAISPRLACLPNKSLINFSGRFYRISHAVSALIYFPAEANICNKATIAHAAIPRAERSRFAKKLLININTQCRPSPFCARFPPTLNQHRQNVASTSASRSTRNSTRASRIQRSERVPWNVIRKSKRISTGVGLH